MPSHGIVGDADCGVLAHAALVGGYNQPCAIVIHHTVDAVEIIDILHREVAQENALAPCRYDLFEESRAVCGLHSHRDVREHLLQTQAGVADFHHNGVVGIACGVSVAVASAGCGEQEGQERRVKCGCGYPLLHQSTKLRKIFGTGR